MAAQGAQGRQQLVIVLRIADGQAQVLPPAQLSGQILHQRLPISSSRVTAREDRPPSSSTIR